MDQGGIYNDYYTPFVNTAGNNRKYNLGLLNSEISKIFDTSGIVDFKDDLYYTPDKLFLYNKNNPHFWKSNDNWSIVGCHNTSYRILPLFITTI